MKIKKPSHNFPFRQRERSFPKVHGGCLANAFNCGYPSMVHEFFKIPIAELGGLLKERRGLKLIHNEIDTLPEEGNGGFGMEKCPEHFHGDKNRVRLPKSAINSVTKVLKSNQQGEGREKEGMKIDNPTTLGRLALLAQCGSSPEVRGNPKMDTGHW